MTHPTPHPAGAVAAIGAALLLACTGGSRTEILIEVTTDLPIPDRIDEIVITAESPDGRTQRATAALSPGIPLPRTLGMVHETGPLGPYLVTVAGLRRDAETVSRGGSVTFVEGQTRVWRVELLDACVDVACGGGETCARGGCRSVEVGQGELETWNGVVPVQDAGPVDACVPDERCNEFDDDCDGMTDEGFDTQTDRANCGACGNVCTGGNATWACNAGRCEVIACDAGFLDCNGSAADGCESNPDTDPSNCGGCGTECGPPNRECCAGVCARDC